MYCYYKNQEACRNAKNHEPSEKQDIYKAKLFQEAIFFVIIFLPQVNIQVQNDHGVLGRLISCI